MIIESMPIASLAPDTANARKHSQKNLDAIKGSLKKFGQQKPIVVDNHGVVVAGNGTLAAAKELGWPEINVVRTKLTGPEAIAFALADNRTAELAEWDLEPLNKTLQSLKDIDFDLGSIGFDQDFMEAHTPTVENPGLTDPDEVPENVETRCKPGDLWILGNHRLLCGDSTNVQHVERLMGGEKAELCFTSPPYADQREYNGGKELSTEYLATFLNAAASSCELFAVNLGMSRKNNEVNPYWDDYIKAAKVAGLKFLSWNVWDKDLAGSVSNQTAMFSITHEWVFIFGKHKKLNRIYKNDVAGNAKRRRYDPVNINGKQQRLVRQADGSTKLSNRGEEFDEKQMSTVLVCTPVMARNIDHPAQFPVELAETYILGCSSAGSLVYEPFTGSGSTLIACEKTGRHCYGMEIDPNYCSVIIERWEKFTGKKAVLSPEVTPI